MLKRKTPLKRGKPPKRTGFKRKAKTRKRKVVPIATRIRRIKKRIWELWAHAVKTRDGWKCALCGAREALTAHHWIVPAGRSLATRYITDNGITLCYVCHIIKVHREACSETLDAVRRYMNHWVGRDRYDQIQRLGHTTVKWSESDLENIEIGMKSVAGVGDG